MAINGFCVHTNHIPAQWQCRQNNGTITTWFIKTSTNYDHLNHHHWEDLLTYILVATYATGTQHCSRSTATLPRSPSAWNPPPQSAQQQQQRLLLPTLVQVEGLDNCKAIHNSPRKSISVQHGHLPSLLGQLACAHTQARTRARTHTHTPVHDDFTIAHQSPSRIRTYEASMRWRWTALSLSYFITKRSFADQCGNVRSCSSKISCATICYRWRNYPEVNSL